MNFENIKFGINILDELLPDGVPRTSSILFAGPSGTGKTFLVLKIMSQFLLRQEPVIYVIFDDDPLTTAAMMSSIGIDVYSSTKDKSLLLVDGFSFRIKDKKGKLHISVVDEVDPENTEQVLYTIIQLADRMGIKGRGIVVIDSLNEVLSYHDNTKVAEFVKNVRANITKYRGILTLLILHTSSDKAKHFLTLVEHVADGIIFVDQVSRDNIISRYITIKRMKGVRHKNEKIEYTISDGEIRKLS